MHTQNAPSQIIIVSQEPGKGDTHSISEAMRMARSHAHIRVQPGIYREQLIIDKPVKLVGEGACEQIVVESYVPCLHIKHDLVTLSNMTVRGKCNPDHKHYPAIYIDKAQPTLKHCDVVSESDVGIGIRGLGADPEIQSCYIHRTRGDGIFFADHARGLVEKCTIVHNEGSGIVIGQETHPRLKECSIRENMHYAIVMLEKSQATVEDCTLTDNQRGTWHIGEDCHINRDRSVE